MTQPAPKAPHPSTPALYTAPPARESFARHLRSTFIAGLLTFFPLFITAYILYFIYDKATFFSRPIAVSVVPWMVHLYATRPAGAAEADAYDTAVLTIQNIASPILALIISLAIVYCLGLLGTFVIGKRILAAGDHFIGNLPLIKGIYGTSKQVIGVFRKGGGGQGFQRVVLVEFPRLGTWTIGFVTNTITDLSTATPYLCVFIPMTPNPTSGFFQLFPVDQVRDTDWTIDQGIKMVLSGGLLTPTEIHFTPAPPAAPPFSDDI